MQSIIVQTEIKCILDQAKKPISFFLNGGCLWFAKALQKKIGGNLRYLIQEAHVVLEINQKLYDATGNVTSKYKNSKHISEEELKKRPRLLKELTQRTSAYIFQNQT